MLPTDPRDRLTPPAGGPAIEPLDTLLAGLDPAAADRVRALVERGRRHEARLQLLQQIAASLARTLDEDEILEELARGVRRAVDCEGVVVARVDLDRALVEVVHHSVGDSIRATTRVAPLGQGPLGEAARSGAPVMVAPYDAATSPLAAHDDVLDGVASAGAVLAVPVMHGRRLLGVVGLHDPRVDAFDADAREVVGMLGRHAAGALSNARLFAESERERRQSEAMAEIARAVGESLKMGEVLRLILRHAMALLQAEGACVALREGDYLHIVSALGITEVLAGVHMPVAGSLSGRVVTSGMAVVTNDITAEPDVHRPTVRLVPIQRSVIVPLMTARGILGVIAVYNGPGDFTTDDARVLQRLADQVAVAVVNARLFEEVRDATREWSAAFDSIGVGMCLVDDQRRITRANAHAVQLTEDPALRTLLGRPFYETVLGAVPEDDGDPLGRAIDDGVQARTVCEGTNGRWLEVTAVPHPNGGAIVTFDDVSAQRAAWDRHRLIVESAADALCTLDREGRVIFANPAARALFARDDLTGMPWSELLLHEMAEEARVHVQLAASDEPQRHEYVVVRGDGERRVVAAALSPVHEGEAVAMVVASLHDVTNARRAREAVTSSEARYRQLFDSATDAVLTLNLTGAITSANPSACEVFDTPGEQLLGRSFLPCLAPGDLDRVTTFLRDAHHGDPRPFECRIVRRNGSTRTLRVAATPLREGRVVTGLLLVARDVSEERARTDVLHRSEARYALLAETAPDAIFTVDEEGNFTSVNRAFEAATGHGRDAITGHHFTEVLDPRDRESIWELFVAVLHGARESREVRYLDATGRSRVGSLVASPVVERGRVTGVMGVVRDVTNEQRLREALLRRERQAAVGELLGGGVHDLGDPLSAVLALSDLLLDEGGDADGHFRETLQAIRSEAARAGRVMHHLIDVAGERSAPAAALRLADVVARALAGRRRALDAGGVTVSEEVPGDLPVTRGDPGRLAQAVLHLIERAEQAMRDWSGPRSLTLRLSHVADTLVLDVEATGPGIAASGLERPFGASPIARAGGDVVEHLGVGLAVADGIIREHGGRLRAESRPGTGAAFVVEIPIVSVPPERSPAPVNAEQEPIALDVLVVDDEPAMRTALGRMLGRLGHRVTLAADRDQARQAIEGHSFDRILLDLRRPPSGGEDFLVELHGRRPELVPQVVVVTEDVAAHAAAQRVVREGGCPVLLKPFTMDDVRRVLSARPAADHQGI